MLGRLLSNRCCCENQDYKWSSVRDMVFEDPIHHLQQADDIKACLLHQLITDNGQTGVAGGAALAADTPWLLATLRRAGRWLFRGPSDMAVQPLPPLPP